MGDKLVPEFAYIDASEAETQISKIYGDPAQARRTLAESLRDGKIQATAALRWESQKRKFQDAWEDDADSEDNVEVGRSFWRSSRDWERDISNWRWADSRFAVNSNEPGRTPHWIIIDGVKFRKIDVDEVAKFVETSVVGKLRKGNKGGRRPEEEHWLAVTMALLDYERAGRLNRASFPEPKSLREEILIDINEAFSDGTLLKRINQIYRKYVDPEHR